MKSTLLALAAVTAAGSAFAQVGAYGQCGGNGYSGETACASGYTCEKQNDWYSQCVTGGAAPTKAAATKAASTKAATSVKPASTKAAQTSAVKPASVKTSTAAKPSSTTVNRAGSSSGGVQYAGVNVCQHRSPVADTIDH